MTKQPFRTFYETIIFYHNSGNNYHRESRKSPGVVIFVSFLTHQGEIGAREKQRATRKKDIRFKFYVLSGRRFSIYQLFFTHRSLLSSLSPLTYRP